MIESGQTKPCPLTFAPVGTKFKPFGATISSPDTLNTPLPLVLPLLSPLPMPAPLAAFPRPRLPWAWAAASHTWPRLGLCQEGVVS